jgi:MFS transporter, DHA1 family, tetracycline resistance protein
MKNRNASLIFILITVFIDVIGFGIIIPVIPGLISELAHVKTSEASFYGGLLGFAFASAQFICAPLMGALSDKFGRKPVLFFALGGLGVDYLIMAMSPSLTLLFIGRVFAGMMGASFTTASAYIADISAPEKRAQNFGMIGVAFGLGFIVGPLLGGLLSVWGLRAPFYFASGFAFLNLLYGAFVLPESLLPENRRNFEWKRANPIGALKQIKKFPVVMGFILPIGLVYTAHHAVQSNWGFFTMEKFKWGPKEIAYSLAFVGLIVGIVQGGLIRVIIPKFGQKKSVIGGMIFTAIGFILFGIAGESWMMYAFLIPYALGGISNPAIQGILSNQIPANAQGELQGIMTSVMSLTAIIGPLLMNYIFGFFTSKDTPYYFPGAAMIAGAILTVIAVFFTVKPLSKLSKINATAEIKA